MPDNQRPRKSERAAREPRAAGNGAAWRDQAACRHADPDLFFPAGTTGPMRHQIYEAKRICQACPVRTPCLTWALNHQVASGIWGGTTEEERYTIRIAVIRPRDPG
jgi:WhiB family transcriptional regulator, redox-sensing transcriptional regulator